MSRRLSSARRVTLIQIRGPMDHEAVLRSIKGTLITPGTKNADGQPATAHCDAGCAGLD